MPIRPLRWSVQLPLVSLVHMYRAVIFHTNMHPATSNLAQLDENKHSTANNGCITFSRWSQDINSLLAFPIQIWAKQTYSYWWWKQNRRKWSLKQLTVLFCQDHMREWPVHAKIRSTRRPYLQLAVRTMLVTLLHQCGWCAGCFY